MFMTLSKKFAWDRKDLFILLASLSLFMELFDSTVLFTSLAEIARHFKIETLELKSAVINYFIGLSVFISICSYLANKYTEKKIFIFACLIFILASLACGLSNNATQLAVFRFIQGAGASLMSPMAIMMLYRAFPSNDIVKINSLVNIPALIGAALGPLLGGIITEKFYWGWIFFINIPIGLILILLCVVVNKINPLSHLQERIKFDKLGFLFVSVALITASILIDKLNDKTMSSMVYFSIFVLFIASIVSYLFHYKKHKIQSIIDFSIFKIDSFKCGIFINILARIGISGIALTIPLFLQDALGFSTRAVGFVIMFVGIGAILSKIFLSNYITKYGFTKSLSASAVTLMLSILLFCFLGNSSHLNAIAMLCLVYGIINSFQYTAMNSLVLKDISQDKIRKAVNINAIFQQFSNALGVCLAAYIISLLSNGTHIELVWIYKITFMVLAFSCLMTLFIANSKSLKASFTG